MPSNTLCDCVRGLIRDRYQGTGEEFPLSQVYAFADIQAPKHPRHRSLDARQGVMRRMLQYERKHRGLEFVRPGIYKYHAVVTKSLDTKNPPVYAVPMNAEQATDSIDAREAARQAGHRFYTSERPCKTCGGATFYTSGGMCRPCALRRSAKHNIKKKIPRSAHAPDLDAATLNNRKPKLTFADVCEMIKAGDAA